MSTLSWSLCTLLVSIVALGLLAQGDPKRLRTGVRLGASPQPAMPTAQRRLLAGLSLLPGVLLAVLGQWPAFLIWLGATSAAGWALAQTLSPRPK